MVALPAGGGCYSCQVHVTFLVPSFVGGTNILSVNSDFLSYCMFAFSCFRVPENLSMFTHLLRYVSKLTT